MEECALMNTLRFAPGRSFMAGDGSYLIDESGNRFLDFYGDVGTASLGYASEHHVKVFERMARERIPVHSPLVFRNIERDRAAKRLTTGCHMDRVFFCNSGAEAVEAAIKCARKTQHDRGASHRVDIYTVHHGFHGRTYGALAAGDGPTYHHAGFGPLPSGFKRFTIREDIRHDAAAVCIAPVFGNNDVRMYPKDWLAELREFCDDHGILLIFDEVQSGSGRTGGILTYGQKIGVMPDIVCLAKGIAMGASCGAMLARGDAALALTPGSHFSTFGGQPLASAFLNGMLDYLLAPRTKRNIEDSGEYIRESLKAMDWTRNVRGVGMLNAFDIDVEALSFAEACLGQGLLLGVFRAGSGPIKITPPLNVQVCEIDEGMKIMDEAYRHVRGR